MSDWETLGAVDPRELTDARLQLHWAAQAAAAVGKQFVPHQQAVAGQMMGFFAEVGCVFPQFPFIAHSRGWTAEDMERNVAFVKGSEALHEAARELAGRAVDMAKILLTTLYEGEHIARAGRKGSSQGTAPESPAMAAAMAEEG
jgi:hypothetical protein